MAYQIDESDHYHVNYQADFNGVPYDIRYCYADGIEVKHLCPGDITITTVLNCNTMESISLKSPTARAVIKKSMDDLLKNLSESHDDIIFGG